MGGLQMDALPKAPMLGGAMPPLGAPSFGMPPVDLSPLQWPQINIGLPGNTPLMQPGGPQLMTGMMPPPLPNPRGSMGQMQMPPLLQNRGSMGQMPVHLMPGRTGGYPFLQEVDGKAPPGMMQEPKLIAGG